MSTFPVMPRLRSAPLRWVALSLVIASCQSADPAPWAQVQVEGEPVARPAQGRVIVLGLDALGPETLRELVREHDVPSFARILREGVLAEMDVRPARVPPLSPRIWQTISTGQLPEQHGILDWAYPDEQFGLRLFASTDRRAPAIWNIASALGRRVGVVNWLTSYPAERVAGFVIADRFDHMWAQREADFARAASDRDRRRGVYPRSLIDTIGEQPPRELNRKIVPAQYEAIDREVLRMGMVAQRRIPVDLLMLYMRAYDEVCHLGWKTHEPLPGQEHVHGDRTEAGRDVVIEYLLRFDWILQEVLSLLGPQDHFVLVSDHGFEPNPESEGLQGIHESETTAVATFVALGPRLRRDVEIGGISVLDVVPTVLELSGLPSARNLPGEIVASAFLPQERDFLPPVESYLQTWHGTSDSGETGADEAIMERLRSLGYIDGADGNGGH